MMGFTPSLDKRRERYPDPFRDLFSECIDYAAGWPDSSFMLLSQMKKPLPTKKGGD